MPDPWPDSATLPRRTFVGWVGALMSLIGVRRSASALELNRAAPSDQQPPAGPDPLLLTAVGEAVLPGELGADGIATAVRGFANWIRSYKPGAELLHGYGTGEIKYASASPLPTWRTQLTALDQLAREKTGKGFVASSVPQRQAVIRVALADRPIKGFSEPQAASHVALALLSWYYDTPGATDLCYGVAIMKNQCRALSQNPNEPVPLRKQRPDGSPRKLTREDDA